MRYRTIVVQASATCIHVCFNSLMNSRVRRDHVLAMSVLPVSWNRKYKSKRVSLCYRVSRPPSLSYLSGTIASPVLKRTFSIQKQYVHSLTWLNTPIMVNLKQIAIAATCWSANRTDVFRVGFDSDLQRKILATLLHYSFLYLLHQKLL